MSVSGVRSSWLTLAKKSDLAVSSAVSTSARLRSSCSRRSPLRAIAHVGARPAEQPLTHRMRQLLDPDPPARTQHDGVAALGGDAQGHRPVEEHREAGDRRREHRLEVIGRGEVDRDACRELAPHPRLALASLVTGHGDDEAGVLGGRRHA